MDEEMIKALEADGEKLRQLTGEDHGPWFDDYSPQEFKERRAYAAGHALTAEERRRWDLP